MVAGARARTIPCAKDLADLAGMRVDRFLRSAHSNRLACAHGGNARRGKATAGSFGATSDIGREAGAGVLDMGPFFRSAIRRGDADTGGAACTGARTVGNGSLDEVRDMSVDDVRDQEDGD
ncbi:MAG: hypothetical protein LQ343_005944 [Gyalolechia ehrenbergii]|nr:MAG: hypothetical protein LQ343_005944 [Gyalolechia ehrenbergii]